MFVTFLLWSENKPHDYRFDGLHNCMQQILWNQVHSSLNTARIKKEHLKQGWTNSGSKTM